MLFKKTPNALIAKVNWTLLQKEKRNVLFVADLSLFAMGNW